MAIQDAMGWTNSHMHTFMIGDKKNDDKMMRIGIENEKLEFTAGIADWLIKLTDYFDELHNVAYYEYDMGDSWTHAVIMEKELDANLKIKYPICIDGKRACPPEDVGGSDGYMNFCKIIKNPKHPEHEEMLDWVGFRFNPEKFDYKKVEF